MGLGLKPCAFSIFKSLVSTLSYNYLFKRSLKFLIRVLPPEITTFL